MFRYIYFVIATYILIVVSSTPTCVKLVGKSTFCSNLPAKVCSTGKENIDAIQFSLSSYNTNVAKYNGTLMCPANPTAPYMDSMTFCNSMMSCDTNSDCLPVCFSVCTQCFDEKTCLTKVKSGLYAAKNASPCFIPGSQGHSTPSSQPTETPSDSPAPTKKPSTSAPKPTPATNSSPKPTSSPTQEESVELVDSNTKPTPKPEWKPKTPKPIDESETSTKSPSNTKKPRLPKADSYSDEDDLSSSLSDSSSATTITVSLVFLVISLLSLLI